MKNVISKRKLLVLYGANSVFTSTVRDYLDAFRMYSAMSVSYANAVHSAKLDFPFDQFDAVLVHYSVRLCEVDYISPDFARALATFAGVKVLTIQDEYENTEVARTWMEKFEFDLVLTCVPEAYIENIYPKKRFPRTEFRTVLTGYVPSWLAESAKAPPIKGRPLDIVYRGRPLHYVYGRLAREKTIIGSEVKRLALRDGLNVDIETAEFARIYGDAWFEFLKSGKTTLGSESGANVFDFDGSVRRSVEVFLAGNPRASFDEVAAQTFDSIENRFAVMNQISPKVFEAIVCGTALVLFEGAYSGVLKADRHYVALEKDFSNWSEVASKIKDDAYLQNMTEVAKREIIDKGEWTYGKFVREINSDLARIFLNKKRVTSPEMSMKAEGVHLFDAPVDLATIEIMERKMAAGKLLKNYAHEFDFRKSGELLRFAWVKGVPAPLRKILDPPLKNIFRRFQSDRTEI